MRRGGEGRGVRSGVEQRHALERQRNRSCTMHSAMLQYRDFDSTTKSCKNVQQTQEGAGRLLLDKRSTTLDLNHPNSINCIVRHDPNPLCRTNYDGLKQL